MSNNELVDVNGARILYNDLRGRIPPPVDPSSVIDDETNSATDKSWSASKTVDELLKKASVIIASVSGNPISVDDAIPGQPVRGMKITFAPKQSGSGDPSPTNIRPITGWTGLNIRRTGKNLLRVDDSLKLAFNSNYSNWTSENGVVSITGNATGGYIMPCLPGTDYVYSFETTYRGDNLVVRVYEFSEYPVSLPDGTLIYNSGSSATKPPSPFTTTANGHWLVVGFYAHHSENITIQKMQIELGSTATAYEPYSGTIIPISWQSEAGTVYGGELDALTGALTVTHAVASAQKSMFGDSYSTGIGYRQTTARYDKCLSGTDWNKARQTQIMPNGKIANPYSESTHGDYVGIVYQINPHETKATLRISEALYQTLGDEDIVSISYELLTPYIVQLTSYQIALLVGTNTICTDADSIAMDYAVDTKKYVDASGVKDVQLNGTSLANNGIVNFPYASSSEFGLVGLASGLAKNESTNKVFVQGASAVQIKAGTDVNYPIVPGRQHQSIFYGLAKAAGDAMQAASSNAVGTYTDSAKIAIQKMLGLYVVPWEKIIEDTATFATKGNIYIEVDRYGNYFELTDVRVMVYLPQQDNEAKVEDYGRIKFVYGSSDAIQDTLYIGAWTQTAGSYGRGAQAWIEQHDGMIERHYSNNASSGSSPSVTFNNSFETGTVSHWELGSKTYRKIIIEGITGTCHYIVFGKRKLE